MRMGSINAIVSSCGAAAFSLTGGDMQQRPQTPRRRQTAPLPSVPFRWEGLATEGMEIYSGRVADPISLPRSAKGQRLGANTKGTRERSQHAGLARTQPVKRTTNTYACNRCQAEMNNHENQKIITSIYMRGEETHKKNGTLQSILLPLVSYRI